MTKSTRPGVVNDERRGPDRRPRITMVIDELGPGGSQRQFSLLATSLRRIGYEVKVIVFRPGSFFVNGLRDADVPVVHLQPRNRVHLWFLMRRQIRREPTDVVIGFLPWANLMIELSALPTRTFGLVVSERSLDVTMRVKRRIAYHCHRFADVVVSNSHAQGEIVERVLRRWNVPTRVIVNGVDVRHFRPAEDERRAEEADSLRLLVLARFSPEKNVMRFIEAVSVVCRRHPRIGLKVAWYGKAPIGEDGRAAWTAAGRGTLSTYYGSVVDGIARYELEGCFTVNAPRRDVRSLYQQSDVVCMPSLYEGCSNVIAEAMACGVPVLASRVGDNARLVQEGRNGLLFDPLSVEDMARTIVRFAEMADSERTRLGREGRRMAEELLSMEVLTDRYVKLIAEVDGRRRALR